MSCAFYFSLQQWFHRDQFVHIMTMSLFRKLGFAVTAVMLGKDFHFQVLTLLLTYFILGSGLLSQYPVSLLVMHST